MRILPQSGSNEKESIVKASGKWEEHEKWIKLKFKRTKIDLKALFDKQYSPGNEYRNTEERSIEINSIITSLTIWGVTCIKEVL